MLKGGFIGVDIFFIISGFLISSIIFENLEHDTFSFVEFYSRRIKRIFPALLLVLIACYTFGWFLLLADEYKQLGKHIAGGAGFVSNFMFWKESGYFDNAAETKPLLHLWSLGIEEQFYIIWPLLLWFVWKQRLNFLTIPLAVVIISFVLNIDSVHSDTVAAFYSPQTRFWELSLGSVLAYFTLYKQNIFSEATQKLDRWLGRSIVYAQNRLTLRNAQSLLGATFITIGIVVITKEKNFPGWWALLPTVGAVLIISAGMEAWLNRTVLSNHVLVWFGLISFPLYLWHWSLLSFARIMDGEKPSQGVRIAAVLISIVLAWLTYLLVEKPMRFGAHSKMKVITLFILMIVVGYTGYSCYQQDGLSFRHPTIVANQADNLNQTPLTNESCIKNHPYAKKLDFCFESEKKYEKTIFLIGDSHMGALLSGFIEKFKKNDLGYNILAIGQSGCQPFINTESITEKNVDYICQKFNTLAIEEAAVNQNIDWVIIVGRHAARYSQSGFGNAEKSVISWTYRYKDNNITSTSASEVFSLGLKNTLKLFNEGNKNIVFVHEVPELGFSPRNCLKKRGLFQQKSCFIDKDTVNQRQKPYRESVKEILKELPTVNIYDPMDLFCDESNCRVFSKTNSLMYLDDNHINKIGAEIMADEISKIIQHHDESLHPL
jgi:peptidoglycan/LPS O-acetylase OafA/YrhL